MGLEQVKREGDVLNSSFRMASHKKRTVYGQDSDYEYGCFEI